MESYIIDDYLVVRTNGGLCSRECPQLRRGVCRLKGHGKRLRKYRKHYRASAVCDTLRDVMLGKKT